MEFDLDDAVAILSRTPAVLEALLGELPPGWTSGDEGPDTWSPYDVVGHLIHGERTDWIPRARIILEAGESRAFEPFDRFAQERESRGKSLAQLLDEFSVLRTKNLAVLHRLDLGADDLARRGRHPGLGPVTLGQLLATWVAHDLGHVAQITRVMAKQYGDQVGPWKAYMPVLSARR